MDTMDTMDARGRCGLFRDFSYTQEAAGSSPIPPTSKPPREGASQIVLLTLVPCKILA
jgi:hypothetical protein